MDTGHAKELAHVLENWVIFLTAVEIYHIKLNFVPASIPQIWREFQKFESMTLCAPDQCFFY